MKKSKRVEAPATPIKIPALTGGAESGGSKQPRRVKARAAAPASPTRQGADVRKFVWWPWAAAAAALLLVFVAYGPALNGAFVFDDRYLPFFNRTLQHRPLLDWIRGVRPMLMLSFWVNYAMSGEQPAIYHATNVLLHFFNSILVALIAMRLLELAPLPHLQSRDRQGAVSEALLNRDPYGAVVGIFAGALFLLHPLQTESVAYVASRSEVLSVFFYYGAYCVFLFRRTEKITWARALAVLALFAAAASTKEHTLTLPVLLLLTDLYWVKGGIRANLRLYALLTAAGAVAAVGVWRVLAGANTAGFHTPGFTPLTYLYTQGRMFWIYLRLLILPFGQNADPEIAISHTPWEHGAIFGLLAIAALLVAAWVFRKRLPLACFGVVVFVLLLAPTSSFIPIQDPLAERRVYLPFLGFALVCVDLLRGLPLRRRLMIEVPALLLLLLLTYQRSAVWGSSLALWQDTAEKSPNKVRPRFQVAFAYYEQQNCPLAAENFEKAASLAPPDYSLLVDWAYALDCEGKPREAIEKLHEATQKEFDPQAWALLGMVYGKQRQVTEALDSLQQAQNMNPNFVMTYSIRGNVYESMGDFANARAQYQYALTLDPYNESVRESLTRVLNGSSLTPRATQPGAAGGQESPSVPGPAPGAAR
jgi:protein O-mannosyl-transferase